ncbi:MAG: hypothetical protein GY739_06085 [Mesoflavibacter sp.]|nr:hypothetical protein [Mesoflavibacter sp.]
MIQKIILQHEEGDILLEDALIEMELMRHKLELELNFLKQFKHEKSIEIATMSKEYKDGYKGHKFEVREGRRTWNFKGIEEWQTCNKAKLLCEKKYKAMFEAKTSGAVHANISKEGEELQLPEINYGKPSVIIKEIV